MAPTGQTHVTWRRILVTTGVLGPVLTDRRFSDLDEAVQAVHTAGHQGDPERWQEALDAALSECRTSAG